MQFIIIQNTTYHFEVTASLYSTLKKMGYESFVYICDKVKNENLYFQNEFITENNIETIDVNKIDFQNSIGFVVSAYPFCNRPDVVPNINDVFFNICDKKRLFFICHRMKKQNNINFTSEITLDYKNILYLTPLSSMIDSDYIWLTEGPVKPNNAVDANLINLTIQGDFTFKHREGGILNNLLNIPNNGVIWQAIGKKSGEFTKNSTNINDVKSYENLSQIELYDMLNKKTDIIIPCIDSSTRNGDYIYERYSTSFLYAYTLEKPIFAHEIFKHIYKLPGLYYHNNNLTTQYEKLYNFYKKNKEEFSINFSKIKKLHIEYNSEILEHKIKNLC